LLLEEPQGNLLALGSDPAMREWGLRMIVVSRAIDATGKIHRLIKRR
jgi:hypothetical protein